MRIVCGAARPGDARALARIMLAWINETDWVPRLHGQEETEAYLADLIATRDVRVAREGAAVLGFLARDGAEVMALYVAPKARGRGAGRALLGHAKAQGPFALWCFVANDGARRFYAREGLVEGARTDGAQNDEGLPDVRITWAGGA